LTVSHRIKVNPIACDAHGMCAELLPERIELDDWGYPIVDSAPLEPALLEMARRAVQACPTLALLVESGRSAPPDGRTQPGSTRAQS
jgi:ferredoxin